MKKKTTSETDTRAVTVQLGPYLYGRLTDAAKATDRSRAAYIRRLLAEHFGSQEVHNG